MNLLLLLLPPFSIGAAKCYCNVRSIRKKKDCAATFFLLPPQTEVQLIFVVSSSF